ncbi:MAG TPA: hypothetical protein VHE60_11380 [Pyrinomonadaceae bacterium]|nr:hypothetical protein [Pyrinomonadaceae bacterium]
MGDEVTKIGKASARAGTQMKVARMILGTNSAGIVFWIASRTAKKLNKHSRKLEQQLAKLEKTTDLLIESNVGYLTWFSPSTEQEQQKLASDRTALIRLLDITRNATKTMQEFRDSQDSTKGISQELNTALNIMSHVTEGIVAFLRKADKHWQELIEIIDNKNTA